MSSPFKHRTAADSAQHLSRHQKFRRKHDGSPVPSPVPSPAAATPGGSGLTVLQFMEARALELNSLLHSAQRLHGPRHALQSLPRHMRRRAVSHNPKRLPRRLREPQPQMAAVEAPGGQRKEDAAELAAGTGNGEVSPAPDVLPAPSSEPTGRFQPAPGSCDLAGDARLARQALPHGQQVGYLAGGLPGRCAILQVGYLAGVLSYRCAILQVCYLTGGLPSRWGYRLPDHPSDKSLRAAYRAMVHHCLIQDISYYGCIELTGPQDNVLRLLAHFTHKDTGDFCSVSSSEGSVEGSATLYRCDCCPHQVLGPVTYMVRSQKGQGEDPSAVSSCQLWLWTHPACTMDILQELQQVGRGLLCREERDAVGVTGDNRRVAGGNSHVAGDNGRVPILLVHQQGRTADRAAASALGTGWDVIMPAGWAMVFWLGFIYRGARAGGLREMRRLHLETGQLFFPDDFPDTGAYRTLQQEQAAKLREQHDRYPPGKRPNFARLGTAAPFHCPWERLVAGWAQLAGTESPGQPQGAQLAGTETSGQLQGAQLAGTETSGQPQGAQLAGTETSGQPQGAQLAGTETSGQLQGAQLAGTETSGQPQGAQLAGTETSGQLQGAQLAGTETSGQPRGLCVARDSRIRKQLSQLCRHGDRSHADHPELVPVLTYLVAVRLRMVSRGTPVAMAMICAPTADDVSGGVAGGAACDPVEPAHPEGRTSDDCDVVRHCSRLTLGYVSAGANSLSLGRGVGVGLCALQGLLGVLQLQGQGQPPVVLLYRHVPAAGILHTSMMEAWCMIDGPTGPPFIIIITVRTAEPITGCNERRYLLL
uniref:Uncharacterized protein n=1 Tax=Branchiostoma floridae TaxID=7739 RepID=C3ZWL8_BRAFL|eukprot:XP_002587076.1 hypothetical protein BRAFLDRAFT_102998 [Branchiostoma floridae]